MQEVKTASASLARLCLSLAFAFGVAGPGAAQDYPGKAVKLLVGFPAGTTPDLIARELGTSLSATWGQPVVVINRPGAGGVVAMELLTREAPDGLTLYLTSGAALTSAPFLYKKLGYDPFTAVTPIAKVAQNSMVLVSSKAFADFKGFLSAAKSRPGSRTYAIYGVGSISHITMEKLKSAAGIELVQVSYGSSGPIPDLLAGNVDVLWSGLQVVGLVESGKLNALAFSGLKRTPKLPNVPTVSEMGYPDFESVVWFGLVGPAGVPARIVAKVEADVGAVVRSEAFERRMADLGNEAVFLDSRAFAARIRGEYEENKGLFGRLNIEKQ